MRRAVKINLKFVTEKKRGRIAALLQAYRAAVNFYTRSLWTTPGRLDKATHARLPNTRLSERYKSQALKQALELVVATKRSAKVLSKPASVPVFRGGAVLDAKFVTIEDGRGSFDLMIKLSTLKKGSRVWLPCRRTSVLNKWLSKPGARLIQGCCLTETHIILWVEVPDAPPRTTGSVLGVDVGIHKLISTSDGQHYGKRFREISKRIRKKKTGSKAKARALRYRDNFINQTVRKLPWNKLRVIGVENLVGMKRGKKKNRGKAFRKALAPWTYRRVRTRIEHLAQENRVRLVLVDPRNTSRTCPICGKVSKLNRKGEEFLCVSCGHRGDADTVGAENILARTLTILGSVESPGQTKAAV